MKILYELTDEKNEYTVQLLSDKIRRLYRFDGKVFTEEYSFEQIFSKYYIKLLSVENNYTIYKKIVEHISPDNWDTKAYKRWLFWKYINNESIREDIFLLDEEDPESINHCLYKSKFGFATCWVNLVNEMKLYNWHSLDNFFFHGPAISGVSFKDKVSLKQEIFDCLGDTQKNITLNDGFVLFDYDRIKELKLQSSDEKGYYYFEIKKGKVSYGGGPYGNKWEGSGGSFSVEFLYYNMYAIPLRFKYKTDYIKSILEDAIV